jgi:hypothetical protein
MTNHIFWSCISRTANNPWKEIYYLLPKNPIEGGFGRGINLERKAEFKR